MLNLSCFTKSTAVLKISCYLRRQISYCFQKTWSYFYYLKEKEGFCPIYVKFVLLYWKYSSFENITLFLEANILMLTENMNLFLLLEKAFVPIMSDLPYFTENTAVLKISLYFRRQISYCSRTHELIFIITKSLLSHLCQICLALLQVQQFWKYHAILRGKYPTASRKHDLIFII